MAPGAIGFIAVVILIALGIWALQHTYAEGLAIGRVHGYHDAMSRIEEIIGSLERRNDSVASGDALLREEDDEDGEDDDGEELEEALEVGTSRRETPLQASDVTDLHGGRADEWTRLQQRLSRLIPRPERQR